jgi:hypothetical protein
MTTVNETYRESCGVEWKRVAGAGTHFLSNDDAMWPLIWAIGGDSKSTEPNYGYRLPPASPDGGEMVTVAVPAGKSLWVRSSNHRLHTGGHAMTLTSGPAGATGAFDNSSATDGFVPPSADGSAMERLVAAVEAIAGGTVPPVTTGITAPLATGGVNAITITG